MTDAPNVLAVLRQQIAQIGPILEETIALPWSRRTLHVIRPTNLDELLDRVADDPEQNLPYWSEIWPSGIALADAILQAPERVAGQRVIELGSGVGITAVAAVLAGAELTVTDYAPESLLLCRHNVLANAGRAAAAQVQVNWRTPDDEFWAMVGAGFPVVLAADVLYERRDIAPLLGIIERLVAPGGVVWLAEPGREVATTFLAAAREAGWEWTSQEHRGPWPDPTDRGVVVRLHLLQRRGSKRGSRATMTQEDTSHDQSTGNRPRREAADQHRLADGDAGGSSRHAADFQCGSAASGDLARADRGPARR